ncbi:hypothetical protein [Herbaspirillum rubrisubalbicans]|uniref:hypothetical protein n=1 Tax=Herbaspirillum rubrisubalbicans TaxID=80842 RepID=UPI0015C54DCF|nr:hypothetical protein [Herbaspirillum rubrisubalbicans]
MDLAVLIKDNAKELISLFFNLVLWFAGKRWRRRYRLVHYIQHSFVFLIPSDAKGNPQSAPSTVEVASLVVQNVGLEALKDIQIVFNWRPQYINVVPSRPFKEETQNDGRYVLLFDSLSAGESIQFELLSVGASLPHMITTRSADTRSQEVPLIKVVKPNSILVGTLLATSFVGCLVIIYLLVVGAVSLFHFE